MRIPWSNICRAFPELDHLTDAQCDLLMTRVRLQIGAKQSVRFLLVFVYIISLILSFVLFGSVLRVFYGNEPIPFRHETPVDTLLILCVIGLPAAVVFLLRDAILRRRLKAAIDYEIDRVRCLSCRYILIGQVASAGRIGCPECGASFGLGELGITEADLLPPGGAGAVAS